MYLRSLVPLGLALATMAGCQSYFPYGYGNSSPYPSMPPTNFPTNAAPPSGSTGSSLNSGSGQISGSSAGSSAGRTRGQPAKASGAVPNYDGPGTPPATLGAPGDEDDFDSIKRQGTQAAPMRRVDEGDGEDVPEQALSSVEDDQFLKPTPFRPAAASSDDPDAPKPPKKFRHSPYKRDPGYAWLRGIVTRDPGSDAWRITYSRDPLDDDPYNGSLTLADDSRLDTLEDDDVVLVVGKIDRAAPDRYGKPSYRVTSVRPLQERED